VAFETSLGALRSELKWRQGYTRDPVVSHPLMGVAHA
jgi:hypothetical protein